MPRPKRGRFVSCLKCGKPVWRIPADERKAPRGRFYCSKLCRRVRPEKYRARVLLWDEVKRGKLVRPEGCERCGAIGPVEGHHADYSKPLDAEWICRRCHDAESRPARRAEVERRRKHFGPCACGRPAVVRGRCKGCYMRWRAAAMPGKCNVPDCERRPHIRGLCAMHRLRPAFAKFLLPPMKPGPHP